MSYFTEVKSVFCNPKDEKKVHNDMLETAALQCIYQHHMLNMSGESVVELQPSYFSNTRKSIKVDVNKVVFGIIILINWELYFYYINHTDFEFPSIQNKVVKHIESKAIHVIENTSVAEKPNINSIIKKA